jgi:DNA-binding beta-propeller fold protein YncE
MPGEMARLLPLILTALLLIPAAARADDFQPTVQSCTAQLTGKGCTVVGAQYSGATDVAVSPDGRFAYVAAFSADALLVMDRNPATGALTFKTCVSQSGAAPCAPARAMDGPSDIELTPDGTQALVATRGAGLAVFDRNATTGALTQKAGQAGCVERLFQTEGCLPVNGINIGEGTLSVRFGPGADPTNVYLGSPTGAILKFERTPGTGTLEQRAGTIGCARDDGNFSCLNTVGMGTGEIRQFSVSPDGRQVYVPSSVTASGVAILDRSTTTGTLTQDPDGGGCITATGNPIVGVNQCRKDARLAGNPESLLVSPDGAQVYVAAADRVDVLARDSDTGLLSPASCASRATDLGCSGGVRNVRDAQYLALSPDGEDLVVGDDGAGSGLAFFHRGAGGTLTQNPGVDGCISFNGSSTDLGAIVQGACRSHPAVDSIGGLTFFGSDQLYAGFQTTDAVVLIKRDFAPRCTDQSLAVGFESAVAVPLACVDRNGDALSLSIAGQPSAGQLGAIDTAGARVFYNPFGGFTGADSFKYRAFAGGQTSNTALVSLNVAAAPPSSGAGGLDADRDGFFAGQDCNDANAAIRPGALEIRGNRVDENCDGLAEPFPTVTSGVSAKWDINGSRFKLTQLTISNPPKGAKFEFRCAGRACPLKSKKLTGGKPRRGLVDVRKSLGAKLRYRAGQTIEVRISAAGFNTKVAQIKLRAGKTPSVVALCLAQGASKPQKTCT